MDRYRADIVPMNGIMGTYWRVSIFDTTKKVRYDIQDFYIFSVAQQAHEDRKKKVKYLNEQ